MKLNPGRTALLMIDMQKAFVEPEGGFCIAGAKRTVPDCVMLIESCRKSRIPVIWVKRMYKPDGSDMEKPRWKMVKEKGLQGILAPGSKGPNSVEEPEGMAPEKGETIIIKPRFSAFFNTDLHYKLKKNGIENLILAGTTTPNCIRATCYDAISYGYNVIISEPCCSSSTNEIQKANILDMENIGAYIHRENNVYSLLKTPCRPIL